MNKKITRFLAVFVIGYMGVLAANMLGGDYDALSETDQNILRQFSEFSHSQPLWENYELKSKSLLFIRDSFGGPAYLVNPKNSPNSFMAKKIEVLGGVTVYRISGWYPMIIALKLSPGYFNATEAYWGFDKQPSILGTPVYYLKYTREKNVDVKYSTMYFMPYLAHEAFHFFMQEHWGEGSRFTGTLSEEDLALLAEEYAVLSEIQEGIITHTEADWKSLAARYVAIVEKRMEKNPSYVKKELAMETVEGTASYVGIKAAQAVGYDLGIMYFSNTKHVPFADVAHTYKKGELSEEFLADRMPYETGAQLCFLLDKLHTINWQAALNQQTLDKPVYLYDVVKASITE